MTPRRIFILVILALLTAAGTTRAQEQTDGTLHVLRPLVHAEQESGEVCLEFDHDLDASDHRRAAAAARLESDGKNLPTALRNISIASNLLCISSLEHGREYRLILTGMRGAKGEKMAGAYSVPFTVPDRQPSLTFTSESNSGEMTRWRDGDPVLRALNVTDIRLELFRVDDPGFMAEAWRQRRQASLAPSESATFARDHGKLVWSGGFELDENPNKFTEQKIPLHNAVKDAPPGLYLIVARAPEVKTETGSLAATGALWLLRSGLRLDVLRDRDGFYAFADKSDGTGSMKDVRFSVQDTNGQKLVEGKSDADGTAFLPLPADKTSTAAALVAQADSGDADFANLTSPIVNRLTLPGNEITLATDQAFYAPGAPVSVAIAAHDAEGRPMMESAAFLQLLWPDGSPYTNIPAPSDTNGAAHISFPAPAANGNFSLVWQRGDGKPLAQSFLRVTSNREAPRLEITTHSSIIPADGGYDLNLKSLTNDGAPAPYLAGQVFAAWSAPDHVFQEWKDYRFGTGAHPAGDATAVASFVTDEKGEASLHLTLAPPEDGSLLHAAVLHVQGDQAEGIASPAPLTLPVKPKEAIIGIKPFALNGRFPENSLGRFGMIALDADGHRQNLGDLAYQIYEEGRSFDWHQAEGRWDYKSLQQNRRIGGGALELDAGREDVIEWPVTAGAYRLEITDANGAVRAAIEFGAGWQAEESIARPGPLAVESSMPVLHPGQETQIHFTLDAPSMVSIFIGDDHIRKIIHRPMPKGENNIAFTPEKDWGNRIALRAEAEELKLAGQIELPLQHDGQNAVAPASPPETPKDFSIDAQMPAGLRAGDSVHASIDLKNNGKTAATARVTISTAPGAKPSAANGSTANLAPGQTKRVSLTVNPTRADTVTVKLDIIAPPHFHQTQEWLIPVSGDEITLASATRQKIDPRQSWSAELAGKTRLKPESAVVFLAPAPLFDAPVLLTGLLNAHPATTAEITGTLECLRLWRDPILAAGLQSEAEWNARRQGLLLRLLARQKPDGGFPSLPGDAADFTGTAAVLTALAHIDQPMAKPAADAAAAWLKHRLENTWFDEKERPLRTAAYAALAEAARLDVASLRYFGDTSADKHLPPLAAAQLAFAYAKTGDQGSASYWLDTSSARKDPAAISPSLLPVLADNPFFDPQMLLPAMEKITGDMGKSDSHSIESISGFLRAMWITQHRKGAWRVTVNTDKKNPKDVLVLPIPEKSPPPVIHNTGDAPIYSDMLHETASAKAGAIQRHIYQLNGTEAGDHVPLEHDQTYLVVLEGPWPAKGADDTALIHDDPSFGLIPSGCLPPAPIEADDSLAWLKSQVLTPLSVCEIWDGGIDMLSARKDKNAASWRVAYLAKTKSSGNFNLMPTAARGLEGNQENMSGTKDRIEIR